MTSGFALEICDLIEAGQPAELYTLAGSRPGDCALFFGDEARYSDPSLRELFLRAREAGLPQGASVFEGFLLLYERLGSAPGLYLCGGGHVAVCTAKVAQLAGFSVKVIDERPEFANRGRFPSADSIYNAPYAEAIAAIPPGEIPYFVLVTRSPEDDLACLERILRRPAAYVGMIGSGAKIQSIRSRLLETGFIEEQLARVRAPIGLRIGAKTPEEIAVSIVAEMICEKNAPGGERGWNEALVRALREHGARGAMCTLTGTRGSTPRGPGARMFVSEGGGLHGTIGGGYGEKAAYDKALSALCTGARGVYTFKMNDPNETGAHSIGEIDVLIQPLS